MDQTIKKEKKHRPLTRSSGFIKGLKLVDNGFNIHTVNNGRIIRKLITKYKEAMQIEENIKEPWMLKVTDQAPACKDPMTFSLVLSQLINLSVSDMDVVYANIFSRGNKKPQGRYFVWCNRRNVYLCRKGSNEIYYFHLPVQHKMRAYRFTAII